ncbi:MAG TPA: radical SAM/SPASM domain-containing protein [Bacteroidales bacterium]|nr:radical SAM/SPASM domain-containing protein [Bacteroidales bacterium]HQI69751.1 radical SAM/SPASM domain-containing protein [Bacteroidales bacterium]
MLNAFVNDFYHLSAAMSGKKILNYLRLKGSYFFSVLLQKPVHRGYPSFLSVEPGTYCNLQCPECFTTRAEFSRPRGNMATDTFEKIMKQTAGYVFYLNLYFQGEPFLNDKLFDFIARAKKNGCYTAVSTNGHFLDELNAKKLILSRLDRLIISLDGTDADTYSLYRKGGDFNTVVKGIKTLVEQRKNTKSKRPFIEIQFVLTRKNQSQQYQIKGLGKKLGADKVSVKSFQLLNYDQAREWLSDKKSRYFIADDGAVKIKNKMHNRCFRMWSSCVVTWDGVAVPCCYDKNASYPMGNIFHQPLNEIWNSENSRNFRKKIFSQRKNIDICMNCSE